MIWDASRSFETYNLADELGIEVYAAVGLIEMLFHLATDHAPQGNIGKGSDNWIANRLGWKGEATHLVNALIATGWLEDDAIHRLVIKDWHTIAPNHARMQLVRRRLRFLNGARALPNGDLRVDGSGTHARRRERIRAAGGEPTAALRRMVHERDNWTCRACRSTFDLTIDHVLAVSSGGLTEEANLQTLCRSCNSAKSDRSPEEWAIYSSALEAIQ